MTTIGIVPFMKPSVSAMPQIAHLLGPGFTLNPQTLNPRQDFQDPQIGPSPESLNRKPSDPEPA